MDYPRLGQPILLGLLAILALVLSWQGNGIPEPVRLVASLMGILLLIAAAIATVNLLTYESNQRLAEYRRAMAISERVALVDKISHLTKDQLGMIDKYIPMVEVISGDAGPVFMLRVFGAENIPYSFVTEFLAQGDINYLAAIRNWAEGSREREWAQHLTEHAIFSGWAVSAAGNRPARWIARNRAIKALGLEGQVE